MPNQLLNDRSCSFSLSVPSNVKISQCKTSQESVVKGSELPQQILQLESKIENCIYDKVYRFSIHMMNLYRTIRHFSCISSCTLHKYVPLEGPLGSGLLITT